MNTFIVVALLAVIGSTGVSAGAIDRSVANEEIKNLKGKNLVFSDFCLSARDHVFTKFQQNTATSVSEIAKSGLKMYWDSSMVQMRALEKLTAQLKNPSAPIEGLDENDPTDAVIASGMKKIQESNSYLEKLVTVFSHAVAAYRSNMGKMSSTLDETKDLSGAELVFNSFAKSCSFIRETEAEVRKQFEETKAQVVAKDSSMAEVELENVDCATPKRVLNMATICKFVETAEKPIKSLLGIGTQE